MFPLVVCLSVRPYPLLLTLVVAERGLDYDGVAFGVRAAARQRAGQLQARHARMGQVTRMRRREGAHALMRS